MSKKSFRRMLIMSIKSKGSVLCGGLDLDMDRIPKEFQTGDPEYTLVTYGTKVIHAMTPHVAVIKANIAFFERWNWKGLKALDHLRNLIQELGIPFILDCKRGDILNTATQYALMAFDSFHADAVTIPPYLGSDSAFEFLNRGAALVLTRTTNPNAGEFQDLRILDDNRPLFLHVASKVAEWRNTFPDCGVVAGGTYPDDLPKICAITGNGVVLVPGVGKQGASAEEVIKNVARRKVARRPFVINVSSKIDFADDPAAAAEQYKTQFNQHLPVADGYYN